MRRRILFAGGATGGHLYPGLALAEALRGRGEAEPIFLTERRRLVGSEILEPTGIRTVVGDPPSPGRPWGWPGAARRLARVLDRESIDAVVALGGRPGLLPGVWARWHRRPLFLLEQNRVLGRTQRWLLPCCTRIFLSFDDTAPASRLRGRALRLGCPVRPGFRPAELPEGDPTLLVLGGSQGAQDLNELAPAALARAASRGGWRVIHICGPGKEKGLEARYREAGILARVRTFLQDPSSALREAALVLARAGGSTLAEATAVGRGSLLLPYPHHRDRQQFLNAGALVEAGAAEVVPLDPGEVATRLDALHGDPPRRAAMAAAARALGRPDAAERIAEVIATHLDCDPLRRRDALGHDATPIFAVGDGASGAGSGREAHGGTAAGAAARSEGER